MKRFLAALFALAFAAGLTAFACGGACPTSMKGVERSVKNTDGGVEISFTSNCAETVKAMQAHMAKETGNAQGGCDKHADKAAEAKKAEAGCMFCGHPEWTRKVNNTEKGMVVSLTAANADEIKKIQTMAAGLGQPKGDCPHSKEKKGGCDKHKQDAPRT